MVYFIFVTGHTKIKFGDQLKTLKYVLGAFMLRRTKAKLIECGDLSLPSLTEITVLVLLSYYAVASTPYLLLYHGCSSPAIICMFLG